MAETNFSVFSDAEDACSIEINFDDITGIISQVHWQNTTNGFARIIIYHNGINVFHFDLPAHTAPTTHNVGGAVSLVPNASVDRSGHPITSWNLPANWQIDGQYTY